MLDLITAKRNDIETQITTLQQQLKAIKALERELLKTEKAIAEVLTLAAEVGAAEVVHKKLTDAIIGGNDDPSPEPGNDEPSQVKKNLDAGQFMVEVPKAETSETEQKLNQRGEVEPEQQASAPEPTKGFTELKMLSEDVGYLINGRGEVLAGYAGFTAKKKAEAKGKELSELLQMGYEIRSEGNKHKRLGHKYKLRLLDISMAQLEKLAAELNPQPQPEVATTPTTEDLPEFALIQDKGEDGLLGNSWWVYGVENDRTMYGKVNESLTMKGYRYAKQIDNTIYPTPEDAAKALLRKRLHDQKLHTEMNKAIVSKYMAG